MQTSIRQYAPQKLLQNWKRGLVALVRAPGKKQWWSAFRECYINSYRLYMETFEVALKDLPIKI